MIEQLMQAVGCEKWPERWNTLYPEVVADFEKNGCPYLLDAYYDTLKSDYGITFVHESLYREAASLVRKNRDLSLFAALVCRAMRDRATAYDEVLGCQMPKPAAGTHDLALEMLEALIIFSEIPYAFTTMKKQGLPESHIRFMIGKLEGGVTAYEDRHGAPGYAHLYWNQLIIDGKLHRIGRLELEIRDNCPAGVSAFENANGERVYLADHVKLHKSGYALGPIFFEDETDAWEANIEETDDAYIGHTFDGMGYALREKTVLSKSAWRRILSPTDPVVSIHIPSDGKLKDEDVKETYREMVRFLATYFPDFHYKAFYCASWLLDPQLEALLGSDSNIVKFGKGFTRFLALDGGMGVFYFGFKMKHGKLFRDYTIDDLPEHTSLHTKVKDHYRKGKGIYAVSGVFFTDEIPD